MDGLLRKFEHEGFPCSVWMGPVCLCGYVFVPQGHPWHGKHYDDIRAEVHGGLTYSRASTARHDDSPGDGWWCVGFDAGHPGDAFMGLPGEQRTEDYMEAECRSLAVQARACWHERR